MLDIYPRDRARALEMLNHPWLKSTTRNKDHICKTEEECNEALAKYNAKKDTILFFRELKDHNEQHFDADNSDSMSEDSQDSDFGFCKFYNILD
jgi:hypothetical protein